VVEQPHPSDPEKAEPEFPESANASLHKLRIPATLPAKDTIHKHKRLTITKLRTAEQNANKRETIDEDSKDK